MNQSVIYAGFWSRVMAAILDILMLMPVVMGLLFAVYGMAIFTRPDSLGIGYIFLSDILPIFIVIFFWYYKLATPGKMMMSMKIVDEDTLGRPSFGRLVLRYFAYIVSILPLFLGFIWIAFDKKKQSFHDKIAKTVIIIDDSSDEDFDEDFIDNKELEEEVDQLLTRQLE